MSTNKHVPNIPHKCLLVCNGLQEWITDEMLYNIFKSCTFIHRETSSTAFIAFSKLSQATYYQQSYDQYAIDFHQLYPGMTPVDYGYHSGRDTRVFLSISHAPLFLEKRYNRVFCESSHLAAATKCRPSLFLLVRCTTKLVIKDWSKFFPCAFDIHRTVDQSQVFVEFSTYERADEAFQSIHQQSFTIDCTHQDNIHVAFSATYVEQSFAKKHMKVKDVSAQQKLNYEEALCQRIVDAVLA